MKLGPAGIGSKGERLNDIKNSGLNAAEVEFVYGVKMDNKTAEKIGKTAKELDIKLSVHCPYYINLNSEDKQKIGASRTRILQSCERGHHLGAEYIVFHPGYYGKDSKEETYETIKEQIKKIQEAIKEKKWKVKLAPETTGKINVFGTIDEILKLVKDTKCSLCIDFAHLKARNNGKINYDELFKKLKNFDYIHSHFSGIEYGPKGEKWHIITSESVLKELGSAIKKNHIKNITIINESPDPLGDSIKTKSVFKKLGL